VRRRDWKFGHLTARYPDTLARNGTTHARLGVDFGAAAG
jgi:hypothetical protein